MINNRRRLLRIMAVGTGAFMAPNLLLANNKSVELLSWHGRALGAETSIQLYSDDKNEADVIFEGALSIIEKYERLFSIYDRDSLASQLNEDGKLENLDIDFVKLVKLSKDFYRHTNGAFDISIQPLWNLYKDHFDGNDEEKIENKIKQVLALVGSDNILLSNKSVSFANPGMGISFNGIAQGYITDKVTDYLKSNGFKNVLVDMGEYRAIGLQENGEPWRIGLLDPFDAVSIADVIEMDGGAVATSGGYGNEFDASGKYHHLFDPRSGRSSALYASVTVRAKDATTADALSTAFSSMTEIAIEETLKQFPTVEVRLTYNDGKSALLAITI